MATAKKNKKSTAKGKKVTPLMVQYNTIKAKHPDALLLFRVGDFYETFGTDAITASEVLGIVLTKRANGSASAVELAGFPHHALDTYLPRLVRAGFRVAICEQLEDPKKTKKIVKRGVTEMVTPGIAINDKILHHKSNNYLAAIHFGKQLAGIAFLDVSTGEFLLSEGSTDHIAKLMQSFQPSETIFVKSQKQYFESTFGSQYYTYLLDDWVFGEDYCKEELLRHFETTSLKGFGIAEMPLGVTAAGAVLHYLQSNQQNNLQQIKNISRIPKDQYVWLDHFTIRNLELVQCNHPGGTSLFDVLDRTKCPMGGRMLKKWILLPLKSPVAIKERLDVVEAFFNHSNIHDDASELIQSIGDLERLITRIALQKANPKEVLQMQRSLDAVAKLKSLFVSCKEKQLKAFSTTLTDQTELANHIKNFLSDDPPVAVAKGNTIASGVSAELDDLRSISSSGKDHLLMIQQEESERTGIPSLKIGFNNVFGYYLEVTHRHKEKVPEEWVRKQTLTNAERYITDELKHYEEKILGAQEKILALEQALFIQLQEKISTHIETIQSNAKAVAKLDCLQSFASAAIDNQYFKPVVDDSLSIEIIEGRHPVIEKHLPEGDQYVPNDTLLDTESQQIVLITGPNMSGKSALLRQTALICLMAQIGSFVPAKSARIGWLDRIFTRVGASDNLAGGESTFMVEMNETASIINNISNRSLILLDEIGRGTSTFDGISIAWSLAAYLHQQQGIRPKTLFATHYHELTALDQHFERVKNFSVHTKVVGKKVIFLRKLIPEAARKSFGIHVAKMSGMPDSIIAHANEILQQLESKDLEKNIQSKLENLPASDMQLSIFQLDDPLLMECKQTLENLDINTLTPVEALMKLNELQQLLNGKK